MFELRNIGYLHPQAKPAILFDRNLKSEVKQVGRIGANCWRKPSLFRFVP